MSECGEELTKPAIIGHANVFRFRWRIAIRSQREGKLLFFDKSRVCSPASTLIRKDDERRLETRLKVANGPTRFDVSRLDRDRCKRFLASLTSDHRRSYGKIYNKNQHKTSLFDGNELRR